MKKCIKALQELRCMQLHEVNISLGLAEENGFSLASMLEECVTPANEANAIVLFDNLQNLPLSSQSIIGSLDSIASQDIFRTQLCLKFEKSAEHISSIDLMDAQEVKISKFLDLSSDLRMVHVKDDKPILKETKLTKKLKTIINFGLEVEETTTNK